MRFALATSLAAAAVLACTTAAFAGDLTISVPNAVVRPGDSIDARVAWQLGDDVFVSGSFRAFWKLEDAGGRTVASGRRAVQVAFDDMEKVPYRFRLHVAVPSRARGPLRLAVVVHDGVALGIADFATEALGSVVVFATRRGPLPQQTATFTTQLVAASGTSPHLPAIPILNGGTLGLSGRGTSTILANPAWEGATVRITGRGVAERGLWYIDVMASTLAVDSVEWIDALPTDEPTSPDFAVAALSSRIPPPDLLADPFSWRSLLLATREPRVARTAAEFAAIAADLRPALAQTFDPFARFEALDFTQVDVVVVFTGTTPNAGWRVAIDEVARHDDRTATTWVTYSVLGPLPGTQEPPQWSDACAIETVPKRAGTLKFIREEWLPARPRWW